MLALVLVALPEAQGTALAARSESASRWVKVDHWADGDTVTTSIGRVRLIGVDTPEMGTCGAARLKKYAQRLAPAGSMIKVVNPGSVRDEDDYGRLLLYVVNRDGTDVGKAQIKRGARARYDSRTGYDHHPKQSAYVRLDRKYKLKAAGTPQRRRRRPRVVEGPPRRRAGTARAVPRSSNRGSNGWIYHLPGQQYYADTHPEECFATEAAAQKAGYRRSKV